MDETQNEITYDDVKVLVRWMVENDYTAEDIASAVEKPWKYARELELAHRGEPEPPEV